MVGPIPPSSPGTITLARPWITLHSLMEMNGHLFARPWWLLPVGRVSPWWWIGAGVLMLWWDYYAGAQPTFPVLYTIPVIVAAWYSGRWASVGLAIAVPAVHIVLLATVWTPGNLANSITATLLRATIVLVIALWFARLAEHERAVDRYVQRLEGLLPICSFCKSIRNDEGHWESLEHFISNRSEAQFSHGLCPPCGRRHYPEFDLEDSFLDVHIGVQPVAPTATTS